MKKPSAFSKVLLTAIVDLTLTTHSRAQPLDLPRRVFLEVTLPSGCYKGGKLDIIVNGDEARPISLAQARKDGSDTWIIDKWRDDRKGKRFPRAPITASLRLDDSRTYCRTAEEDKDPQGGAPIARFNFRCDLQPVTSLQIATVIEGAGSFPVKYSRWLNKSPVRQDDLDCESDERGEFAGTAEINSIRFYEENVFLQLGPTQSDFAQGGLRLFSIDSRKPSAVSPGIFKRSLNRHGFPEIEEIANDHVTVTNDRRGLRIQKKGIETLQLRQNPMPNGRFPGEPISIFHEALKNLKYVDVMVDK